MIEGIDVSHYEPRIDWHKVRMQGKHFMFTKVSQGEIVDKLFTTHWKNAKSEGLPRGGYHLYDPRYVTVKPTKQAEIFWKQIENDPGELPLVVDFEAYKGIWHGWKKWYDYMERLKVLSGGLPQMIYTGFYYWRDEGGPKPHETAGMDYFSQYPLWIAAYGTNQPRIPAPWKDWTFWQIGDRFIMDGVEGGIPGRPASVDFNYFSGDEEKFKQFFGAVAKPPDPPVISRSAVLDEAIAAIEGIR